MKVRKSFDTTHARRLLTSAAAQRAINVIEMDPMFRAYFASTSKRLGYTPIDAHWNGAAQISAAKEAAKVTNAGVNAGVNAGP
jgi:hypothetical protein